MEYLTLEFPWQQGDSSGESVAGTVLAGSDLLAASLGAYRFGRRAVIEAGQLRIDPAEVEWDGQGEGMLKLRFAESEYMACRYETATVPHEALLRFRREGDVLRLKLLHPPEENRMEGF